MLALPELLLPALGAGMAAGAVASGLQQFFLTPLIVQAESLEAAQAVGWVPEPWLQRGAYTLLFNCLGAFGFALLLAAGYALRGSVTWRQGVLWGLCGICQRDAGAGSGPAPGAAWRACGRSGIASALVDHDRAGDRRRPRRHDRAARPGAEAATGR